MYILELPLGIFTSYSYLLFVNVIKNSNLSVPFKFNPFIRCFLIYPPQIKQSCIVACVAFRTEGDGTPEDRADESDYYTPEEQHVNGDPLSGDGPGVATFSSVEGTPQRLPGTPISLASGRSSGAESCASGSSTRRLLAPVRGEKTVVHL